MDTLDPPVHVLVGAIAEATPDALAVVAGEEGATYGRLAAWAGHVAGALTDLGVGPGDRVGILVEPSVGMVAGVLGILRSGAAYVPVDPSQPDARLAQLLEDAEVAAVVCDPDNRSRVDGRHHAVVDVTDVEGCGPSPDAPVTATDLAYLIHTSGSTGRPKAVEVEHAQLAASTSARRAIYPGPDSFLLVSPLAFDSSVAGLWGTLTSGGCLVVAGRDEVRDPDALVRLVERHRVTSLLCVPVLYRALLDAAERAGTTRLGSLRTAIVAGEALPAPLVERHFALLPEGVALVNEYGPTEATVWATFHRFEEPGPVAIGRAIPGALLHILDEDLRPVPPGEEGELVIGGTGVARGYRGDAPATAAAFLDDPFVPGGRMYRTGDIVRADAGGTLTHVGRRDHQVKIRGHRVELGEVEAVLVGVPGVTGAVATVAQDGAGLVAFVAAPAGGVTAEAVRSRAASILPAVMVPVAIEVRERLPVTPNGKVDRAALAQVGVAPAASEPSPRATALTADPLVGVAAAWAEVLAVGEVPRDANFFDLGGHSVAVFALQDAIERHTGARPSAVELFRHTTVVAQAALISGGTASGGGRQRGRPDARRQRSDRLRGRAAREPQP